MQVHQAFTNPTRNVQSPVKTPTSEDDVFTQQGGYRVGRGALLSLNVSWPFGSVEVRSGELAMRCITRRLVFPVAAVTGISIYHGMFSVGVRIEHTIPHYPRFVVFWTRDPHELIQRLGTAGYPIR